MTERLAVPAPVPTFPATGIEAEEESMNDLYIIAIDRRCDLLVGCQPDGEQPKLGEEVDAYLSTPDNASIEADIAYETVLLTDDEPADEGRIIWRGHDRGWLTDQDGIAYQYAIQG